MLNVETEWNQTKQFHQNLNKNGKTTNNFSATQFEKYPPGGILNFYINFKLTDLNKRFQQNQTNVRS